MLYACDSGDIYETDYHVSTTGRTLRLTATVTGLNTWEGTGYGVVMAGFDDDNSYAIMQRALPTHLRDGERVDVLVSNISPEVNTMELALTNSLRKRIITLERIDMEDYDTYGPTDTICIDLGNIRVDYEGCMQRGIFDQACIQCHGANGHRASGLDLTEDNSMASLIDVPSTQRPGELRVTSGAPDSSLLREILNEGGEHLLRYNHTEILSSHFKANIEEVRNLIDKWIAGLK